MEFSSLSSFQRTRRRGAEGPPLLPLAQLRATSYRKVLGALQIGAPQNQRRDSRTIPARGSKKPTPDPQREGCSSGGDLRGSRGRRRRKSSPACRSNYHFAAKLQIQKFVWLVGAYSKGKKDSHGDSSEHCLQGRSRMLISRSPEW